LRDVRVHTLLPLPLFLLFLSGCATILDRPGEPIHFESQPAGAAVNVTCSGGGVYDATTPAAISIRRRDGDCRAALSKEGYAPQTVTIEQGLNRRILGNLVPFGLSVVAVLAGSSDGYEAAGLIVGSGILGGAGFVVDWITGRNKDHDPKRVRVELSPAVP
jgi:hypothetical protein